MANPSSEEDGILQEWAPLTDLLQLIPPKAQKGLFTQDLSLTCIDALPEFLVVGTNVGLVYWYNRKTCDLQRLRCENNSASITCVKVVSTVDYMVAAGNDLGMVTVFQIPKAPHVDLPESMQPKKKNQVERYTINGLHVGSITAIEWSMNGMKLFSGDKQGLVVMTEIDFYMHLSKSSELLNEKYEIVQLSYSQQLLLVSTVYRSIICHKDNRLKVVQVGQKERKTLGKFGAAFLTGSKRPAEPVIFASRPGLRLWLADKAGIVRQTLIYKDAVLKPHLHVPLINPVRPHLRPSKDNPHFGKLRSFHEDLILTYNEDTIYLLNTSPVSVSARVSDLRAIHDVAVTKDEIFILEGERSLIRIAYCPETPVVPSTNSQDHVFGIHNGTLPTATIPENLAASFIDFTLKLKDTTNPINKLRDKISSLAKFESEEEEESRVISEIVVPADEAVELPPVVPLAHENIVNLTVEKLPSPAVDCLSIVCEDGKIYRDINNIHNKTNTVNTWNDSRTDLLNKIGEQQFEDVLFKPKKKSRTKKYNTMSGNDSNSDSISINSAHSAASESAASSDGINIYPNSIENEIIKRSVSEETLIKLSSSIGCFVEEVLDINNIQDNENVLDRTSINTMSAEDAFTSSEILVLPKSPTKIEQEVADKEKILAKILNIDELCLDHVDNSKSNSEMNENESNDVLLLPDSECKEFYKCDKIIGIHADSYLTNSQLPAELEIQKCLNNFEDVSSPLSDHDCYADDQTELSDERLSSVSSALSYGPPSDSSAPTSLYTSVDINKAGTTLENNLFDATEKTEEWLQYKVPESVSHLSVCQHYMCCIDNKNVVYYSGFNGLGLKWQKLDYHAKQIAVSQNGNLVWKLQRNSAYALKCPSYKGPFGDEWQEAASHIQCIAIDDKIAWLVSQDGRIYVQKGLTSEQPCKPSNSIPVHCLQPVTYVCCYDGAVIILTSTGDVLCRAGITTTLLEGSHWKKLKIPDFVVCSIALGPQRVAWVVNNKNSILFSDDYDEPEAHWWQLLISDYIYQQPTPNSLNQIRCKITENYLRFQNSSLVACNNKSVWIADRMTSCIRVNNTEFTGHRWTRIYLKYLLPSIKWQLISASSIFEEKGQLWLLSQSGDLFCSRPFSDQFHALPLPSDNPIICIAAAPMTLWVLNSEGKIFLRQGLTETSKDGSAWQELDLTQLAGIQLKYVSCGCDTVWACDRDGMVFMTVGSPHSMSTLSFSSVWIPVEDKTAQKLVFTKVFAGPHTYMVWGIDNKKSVYVREGIFNDFQVGTGWVLVSGIEAVDITISSTAVWALTAKGKIYRRYGITEKNFIGDYWKPIPGCVSALTASVSDGLWALEKDLSLLKHYQLTVRLSSDDEKSKPVDPCLQSDDDWEVL